MPDTDESEKVPALAWRLKKLEERQDRDAKDIRDHTDRCFREQKIYIDAELKEMRDAEDKRNERWQSYFVRVLFIIATPLVLAILGAIFKNPPSIG